MHAITQQDTKIKLQTEIIAQTIKYCKNIHKQNQNKYRNRTTHIQTDRTNADRQKRTTTHINVDRII